MTKASKPRHWAERPALATQYAGSGAWVLASSPRRNCELTRTTPSESVAHGHGWYARPKFRRCFGTSAKVLPAGTTSVPGAIGVASSTVLRNVARVYA